MGDLQYLGTTAGLSHRGDLVQVDEVVVLALRIGVLVGKPVQRLEHLPGIGMERLRSRRGLLALVLLRRGLGGFPLSFLLRGLGGEFRFRIGRQALAVAHDGDFLRIGIPAPDDAFPLGVESIVRHLRIRSDGQDDVAPGGDLAQEAAHFEIVVDAGAVGI